MAESNRAQQAKKDFLSLPREDRKVYVLLRKYKQQTLEGGQPPTTNENTLKSWYRNYKWEKEAILHDRTIAEEYRKAEIVATSPSKNNNLQTTPYKDLLLQTFSDFDKVANLTAGIVNKLLEEIKEKVENKEELSQSDRIFLVKGVKPCMQTVMELKGLVLDFTHMDENLRRELIETTKTI